jgi:hypothetical protein
MNDLRDGDKFWKGALRIVQRYLREGKLKEMEVFIELLLSREIVRQVFTIK